MDLKKIFSYLNHYGARSFISSICEKLLVDRRRFKNIKGAACDFPEQTSFDGGTDIKDCLKAPAASVSESSSHKQSVLGAASALKEADADKGIKKSILYLTHHFYPDRRGGTERFVFNMAARAVEEGHNATVLVLDFDLPRSAYTSKIGGILYRSFDYKGVSCIGFRHLKAPLGLYYKRVDKNDSDMRAFARFIFNEKGTDFVHAAYPQSFVPLLAEAKECGIPYIVTLTDFALLCHYASMVKRSGELCHGSACGSACRRDCPCMLVPDSEKRYYEAREALSSARGVLVPSEFSRRVYANEFPGLSVSVIPHGIREDFVFAKRAGKPKKFLFVGGNAPHKGLSLLLDAFKEITDDDISLCVVGCDGYRGSRDRRVSFARSIPPEDMPYIYKAFDAVIVPSLFYESYNFASKEALACGLLALCADIGAMGETVRDGENGFLFKAADKGALVLAIKKALSFDLSELKRQRMPTVREEWELYSKFFTTD